MVRYVMVVQGTHSLAHIIMNRCPVAVLLVSSLLALLLAAGTNAQATGNMTAVARCELRCNALVSLDR